MTKRNLKQNIVYQRAIDAAEAKDGVEHRYLGESCELRADHGEDDGPTKLVGYAAVFDKLSEDLGFFREIIKPGAFTASLKRGDDVRALLEHEGGLNTLGRTTNGTLKLSEDAVGLRVEITPPDTTVGRDTLALVERGDLSQMSFGFKVVSDQWRTEDKQEIREVLEAELFDVSVVSFPAYTQTDVVARSRKQELDLRVNPVQLTQAEKGAMLKRQVDGLTGHYKERMLRTTSE